MPARPMLPTDDLYARLELPIDDVGVHASSHDGTSTHSPADGWAAAQFRPAPFGRTMRSIFPS